jgi:hypothetical protein
VKQHDQSKQCIQAGCERYLPIKFNVKEKNEGREIDDKTKIKGIGNPGYLQYVSPGLSLSLVFGPEDGGDMFLRNVGPSP